MDKSYAPCEGCTYWKNNIGKGCKFATTCLILNAPNKQENKDENDKRK